MSTLHDLKKKGVFVSHSSSIKPTLQDHHKMARLLCALDHIDPATINSRHGMRFKDGMDAVYVYEEWFNLTKDGRRYILAAGEKGPKRSVTHKKATLEI